MKPEFFSDSVTARWPIEQMLVFCALWTWADDEGRFEWDPDVFRGQLFPCHPELEIAPIWDRIEESKRILSYEVDDQKYGVITRFKKHQHPDKPRVSRLPAPPDQGVVGEESGKPLRQVVVGEEGRGEERKGVGEGEKKSAETQGVIVAAASPVVLRFECNGPIKNFAVTEEMVARWSAQFPALDVPAQLKAMQAWLDAHPRKRKTHRGVPAFVANWLTRQQDRGGLVVAAGAKSRWGSR